MSPTLGIGACRNFLRAHRGKTKPPLRMERRFFYEATLSLPARLTRLEAVGAVDGLVTAWLEGNQGFFATLGTGRGEHLALRAVIAASASASGAVSSVAAATALGAARGATLRILIATAGMELLVVGGEGKVLATLDTGERSVGLIQGFQLSLEGLVNVWTELEDYEVQSGPRFYRRY